MKHTIFFTSVVLALSTSSTFAADAVEGESVFKKKCSTCHQVGADAKNTVGPVLNNIVGNKVAGIEDYKYGASLVTLGESGAVWSEEELSAWLENPKKYLRAALDDKKAKTKMTFKVKKEDERSNLIAYLSTLTE